MMDRRSTRWRLAVAALAAVAFAALAWTNWTSRSDERFIARIEDPASARLAWVIQRDFPDHFEEFRRILENPGSDPAELDRAALELGRALSKENNRHLALASDRLLFNWIKGFRDFAAANDGLPSPVCDPGAGRLLDEVNLSPSLFEAFAEAAADGRDRPYRRPPASDEDLAALEAALNSPEMVDTLHRYRAGDYDWMSPQQRCDFMSAWFDTLARMPEARATRLFVDIEFGTRSATSPY